MKVRFLWICSMIILASCAKQNENASPTYGEAFFAQEDLVKKLSDHQFPTEGLILINENWEFLGSDSVHGIKRDLPEFGAGEELKLPHRVNLPNHSFWYRTKADLQEGYLIIDSDDGAQLWVNGIQIERESELELFKVGDFESAEVIVRGVNNAMSGGLRKVYWLSESDYQSWKKDYNDLLDSLILESKLQQLQESKLIKELAELNPEEKSETLEEYPILLTEPILLTNPIGEFFIRWMSEKAGEAKLLFEDGSKKVLKSEDGVFTYSLGGSQDVSFRISQEKSISRLYEFSLPQNSNSVKLAIWADAQGGWKTFHTIAGQLEKEKPDLSIGAGDLVNNGSELWAFPRLLQKLSLIHTPQLLVPGNHDYDGFYEDLKPKLLRQYIQRSSDLSYGMMKIGPAAIVSLDPNENFPVSIPAGSDQREWFEQMMESEEWSSSPWKIIVLHQPPYSQGWPGYQGEKAILDLLEPYFHEGKIDLVIAGHTHDYERLTKEFSSHPVHFLIVGGAGGGLEPEGEDSPEPKMDQLIKKHHYGILELTPDSLHLEVFGIDGKLLDQFQANSK